MTWKKRYHMPNRRTSMYWVNNAAYLYVEDGDLFVRDEDVYDFKIDFMDSATLHHRDTDMKVSLLDIARPAKQKGKKKLLLLFNNGSLMEKKKNRRRKRFRSCKESSKRCCFGRRLGGSYSWIPMGRL